MRPPKRLPGLGHTFLAMLATAGLRNRTEPEPTRSVRNHLHVKQAERPATPNLLWGLEGTLTDQRWETTAREERTCVLPMLNALGFRP